MNRIDRVIIGFLIFAVMALVFTSYLFVITNKAILRRIEYLETKNLILERRILELMKLKP